STATTTHTVNQTATETVVDGTPDPSVAGEPVLFTAVVTPVAPGAGTPTGTVTFTFTGGGPTLTATLDTTGTATAVTDALPPGLFTVTATYGGDAGFAASSGTTTHTVVQASTTTTVTSFPDPSAFGEDVTFMARVAVDAPGTGVPTGSVTFTFGSGGSATVPLDATGMAVLTESTLPAGTQLVSAFYSGDALHAPSAGAVTHTVTPAVTDTTVVSSPDPSVFGRPVTIAATVTSVAPGAGTPSGSVTFVVSGGTGGG
ncbi:Ig-like domain-containing protein, partial [Streptomyces sodiiphilus]|uniref:Ig-like domain-containing protein n=1 Tax=Streptomyces sodiiphilus TaxID=226217 RepID=UPI0031D081CA